MPLGIELNWVFGSYEWGRFSQDGMATLPPLGTAAPDWEGLDAVDVDDPELRKYFMPPWISKKMPTLWASERNMLGWPSSWRAGAAASGIVATACGIAASAIAS